MIIDTSSEPFRKTGDHEAGGVFRESFDTLAGPLRRHSNQILLPLVIFLLLIVYFAPKMFITVQSGQVGVLYLRFFGGTQTNSVKAEVHSCQYAVGICSMVTPSVLMNVRSSWIEGGGPGGGRTRRAPLSRGGKMSSTDWSKLSGTKSRIREPGECRCRSIVVLQWSTHESCCMRSALRLAGGTRGVDQVGEIARGNSYRWILATLEGDKVPLGRIGGIHIDTDGADTRWQPGKPLALGKQNGRLGIRDHEGKTVFRVRGVERCVGCAGFPDAENGDNGFERTLYSYADDGFGADALFAKVVREEVGAAI